jgi:hypothetical protein
MKKEAFASSISCMLLIRVTPFIIDLQEDIAPLLLSQTESAILNYPLFVKDR